MKMPSDSPIISALGLAVPSYMAYVNVCLQVTESAGSPAKSEVMYTSFESGNAFGSVPVSGKSKLKMLAAEPSKPTALVAVHTLAMVAELETSALASPFAEPVTV